MMLILKYFLVVGAVLTMGLIALNAYFLPAGSTAPAVVHSATSASLPTRRPEGATGRARFSRDHGAFAAAREARQVLASVRAVGSRPPPLALMPGQTAGIPPSAEMSQRQNLSWRRIVGGALAH
jgi:hypothetical protein